MKLGRWTWDESSGFLRSVGGTVSLSRTESDILDALVSHNGQPVSRPALATVAQLTNSRSVDFAVRRLRKKLEEDPANPRLILGVHAVGYRIAVEPTPTATMPGPPRERLRLETCSVDLATGVVSWPGRRDEALSSTQLSVLTSLLQRAGAPVSRDTLLAEVWGTRTRRQRRLVDAAVLRLRRQLEAIPAEPRHLRTVRGVGYRLWQPPVRTNLPTPAGPGIARPDLVQRIHAALERHRLVVIVGPPGVGKTWLAAHVGRRVAVHVPGGAWRVQLNTCRDASAATEALAALLTLQPQTGDLLQRVCVSLGRRPAMTLILDGVEHVVGMDTVLDALLLSDRTRLVVTSSRRINCQAAHHITVPGLSCTQGTQLIREEAGPEAKAIPDGRLADISNALDGNALALRTAARQLRYGPTDHVVTAAVSPSASAAQAIDRAVQACSPRARRALRDLVVFQGSFSIATAAAITQARPAVIQELLDRSLLERVADADEPQFVVYALVTPVLKTQARPGVTDAHGRWFADRARVLLNRMRSSGRTRARAEVARTSADFIAAVEYWTATDPSHAVAIVRLLQQAGSVQSTRIFDLRDALLAKAPFVGADQLALDEALRHVATPDRAELLYKRALALGAAPNAWSSIVVRSQIASHRRIRNIPLGDQPPNPVDCVDWLIFRGRQTSWNVHPDAGMDDLQRALALARSLGDRIGEIRADHGIANAIFHADEPALSVGTAFERVALALIEEGQDVSAATPAWRGAQALALAGALDRAVSLSRIGEDIGRAVDNPGLIRGAVLARARATLLLHPDSLMVELSALRATELARGDAVAAKFADVYRLVIRALRQDPTLPADIRAFAAPEVPDVQFTIDCVKQAMGLSPAPTPPRSRRSLRDIAEATTGTSNSTDPLAQAIAQIARVFLLKAPTNGGNHGKENGETGQDNDRGEHRDG